MAYVPIPFSELSLIGNEEGDIVYLLSSDSDKIDMSSLNSELMKLAEIFLAYNFSDSSNIILIDHSFSSLLMHSEVGWEDLGIIQGKLNVDLGVNLSPSHVAIARAHPFYPEDIYKSVTTKVPTLSKFRLYSRLIADLIYYFDENRTFVSWEEIKRIDPELDIQLLKENLKRQSKLIRHILWFDDNGVYIGEHEKIDNKVKRLNERPIYWYKELWSEIKRFYEEFCEKLFNEQDVRVLMYRKEYSTRKGQKIEVSSWLSPSDVKFLVEVGIKLLIEKSWKKKIMLVGVVKDSSSKYLTRNALSVVDYLGKPYLSKELINKLLILSPTDRKLVEELVLELEDIIKSPISTIEFDSVFSTLRARYSEDIDKVCLSGVRGEIINQNLILAKSLAVFYIDKQTYPKYPLLWHAIFIERLIHPEELSNKNLVCTPEKDDTMPECKNYSRLGKICTYFTFETFNSADTFSLENIENIFNEWETGNWHAAMTMLVLDSTIRNIYPEALGYPVLLHEADIGAKEFGRLLRNYIRSSSRFEEFSYLDSTFRQVRDEGEISRRWS